MASILDTLNPEVNPQQSFIGAIKTPSPTQVAAVGTDLASDPNYLGKNWDMGGGLQQGLKNWWSQPWTAQPILDPITGNPTGKTTGSIMGDFGTMAQYGMGGLGLWNQFQSGKLAKKSFEENKKVARAGMQFGLDQYNDSKARREAQLLANSGMSGQAANAQATAQTPRKALSDYGLA